MKLTAAGSFAVTAAMTSRHRFVSRSTQNMIARISAICLNASPCNHFDPFQKHGGGDGELWNKASHGRGNSTSRIFLFGTSGLKEVYDWGENPVSPSSRAFMLFVLCFNSVLILSHREIHPGPGLACFHSLPASW